MCCFTDFNLGQFVFCETWVSEYSFICYTIHGAVWGWMPSRGSFIREIGLKCIGPADSLCHSLYVSLSRFCFFFFFHANCHELTLTCTRVPQCPHVLLRYSGLHWAWPKRGEKHLCIFLHSCKSSLGPAGLRWSVPWFDKATDERNCKYPAVMWLTSWPQGTI